MGFKSAIKIFLTALAFLSAIILISCKTDIQPNETEPAEITSTVCETQTEAETPAETESEETTSNQETSKEEETTMTYSEKAAGLRKLLDIPDGKSEITVFGNIQTDGNAFAELQKEINTLEINGHMVSFIIADINGNFGIAYNCDKKWTSQSTIKAPYLTSVLMQDADVFRKEQKLIKKVITVSDNEAYEILREKYGNAPFKDFCKAAGIASRHSMVLYPRSITVRDMAKLWTVMYEFINTREDMQEYISYFTGTAMSCVYQGLCDKYKVQTKAGWESGTDFDGPGGEPDPIYTDGDPSNDEIATNDTGIVYAGENPYIIAIFTNLQTDPQALISLVRAIDNAHSELVK